jgi:hypothetical protein
LKVLRGIPFRKTKIWVLVLTIFSLTKGCKNSAPIILVGAF